MGSSALNVVHFIYSTNASLLKNFKATSHLDFLKVDSTYPGLHCASQEQYGELFLVCGHLHMCPLAGE